MTEIKDYSGIEAYYDVVNISVNKIYNTARRKSGSNAVQPELRDELYQAGMIALVEAWNNYDAAKKASFKTYSYYRVRGAMIDYLRNEDSCSRATRASLKCITHNADNTFSSTTLTLAQINTALKRSTIVQQFGISKDVIQKTRFQDIATDFQDNTNDYVGIEAKQTLASMFKRCPLTDREKTIINSHYFEEKNLHTIGDELNITESRVSQIHKEILGKLAKYV